MLIKTMKQRLFFLAWLLALMTTAHAADAGAIVSISNAKNIVRGYTGSFDVVLNTTNTNLYTTLGLDVQLPEGFTYTGYAAGGLLTASHASNIFASDQGSNTYRFSSYANPTADFTATRGVLLTIYFSVSNTAVSGTAYVKNASFSLGSVSYYATDCSAELTVGTTVTLDEDETYTPVAVSGVDVTVNRTLKADVWNTICLPFPMTNAQLKTAFGDDVKLGSFDDYTVNGENISVAFTSSETLAAHTPYIIKVSSAMSNFTVSDVSITVATNNLTVNKGTSKKPRAMIGSYVPKTIEDGDLFLSNNQFKYSKGNSTIKGFRAYFSFNDFDYEAESRTFTIDYFDMTTGIHSVGRGRSDGNAYNLQGQQVNESAKGVQIKNGKKLIIK